MKKVVSDNEFDQIIGALVRDAQAPDADVEAIAESPSTWWAVQRRIALEQEAAGRPWPPATFVRRLLTFGVPAFAAALLLVALFLSNSPVADRDSVAEAPDTPPQIDQKDRVLPTAIDRTEPKTSSAFMAKPVSTASGRSADRRANRRPQSTPRDDAATEVRSEFIALSYGDRPESGNIVRVKVRRSLMVSLGLVASVERPSDLIAAEMVVGDDGRTHAIRFIH